MERLFFMLGGLVCHQMPSRTIIVGGHLLPVCARCTGIYLGIFFSFCFLFLRGQHKANKPPEILTTVFLAVSFLPFMADGTGSYLGIWETNNFIRLITGVFAGYSFPVFLILLKNFQISGANAIPLLKNRAEVFALFAFAMAGGLLCYYGAGGFSFVYGFGICAGIFLLWGSLAKVLWKGAVSLRDGKRKAQKKGVISKE